MEEKSSSPSFVMRVVAALVLALAAWFLLKVVIGIIAGLSTLIVVVFAIVGIVWALGKF